MRDWIRDLYVMEMVESKTEFYYDENGRMVFTEHYLASRDKCCGSGCKHCPFDPKHERGSTKLREKVSSS